MKGVLIYAKVGVKDSNVNLDLSDQSSGVYYLEVTNGININYQKKFILIK